MFKWLSGIVTEPVVNLVGDLIETDEEKAHARSLYLKSIDPNGRMRREISRSILRLYSVYILLTLGLIISQSIFGTDKIVMAIESLKELFMPITGFAGTIISASFGVNAGNVFKGK